jgi:hypothetical protein
LTDYANLRKHGQNAFLIDIDGDNLCRVSTFCLYCSHDLWCRVDGDPQGFDVLLFRIYATATAAPGPTIAPLNRHEKGLLWLRDRLNQPSLNYLHRSWSRYSGRATGSQISAPMLSPG